jgi:hypothetical protein
MVSKSDLGDYAVVLFGIVLPALVSLAALFVFAGP